MISPEMGAAGAAPQQNHGGGGGWPWFSISVMLPTGAVYHIKQIPPVGKGGGTVANGGRG